jgi:hypothetical protein
MFSNGQVQYSMGQVCQHEGVPNLEKSSNLDTSKGSNFIQATTLVNNFVNHKDQFGNHYIDLHLSK